MWTGGRPDANRRTDAPHRFVHRDVPDVEGRVPALPARDLI